MLRTFLILLACASLAACASAPVPVPAGPAAPAEKTPPTAAAPGPLRIAYGLAHAEQWDDLPRDAMPRMRSWTPDSVIGNRVTHAMIAFAGVPVSFGTPANVAEGVRDGMKVTATVIMGAADGSRASFLFVAKDGRHGKVAVVRVAGLASQHALIVGDWPPDADAASLEDFDAAAKSITVDHGR